MPPTTGFLEHFPWGWLDWIFGNGKPTPERVRFQEDVLGYLMKPISFADRNKTPVYVVVLVIEHLESACDEQYAFDFLISQSAPSDYHPRVTKRIPAELVTTTIRYGESEPGTPVFGYTFTSLNTLQQNQDNLRDFVLRQCGQIDG